MPAPRTRSWAGWDSSGRFRCRRSSGGIHPARCSRFAREGRVAATDLIEDYGDRRRIATVAAQVWEFETVLTDVAIGVFEDLTGRLFDRAKNRQERSWPARKVPVGR